MANNQNRGQLSKSQNSDFVNDSYELRIQQIGNITQHEIASAREIAKIKKILIKDYEYTAKQAEKEATDIAIKNFKRKYAEASVLEKKQLDEKLKNLLILRQQELDNQIEINNAAIWSEKERIKANAKVYAEKIQLEKEQQDVIANLERARRAEEAAWDKKQQFENAKQLQKEAKERRKQLEIERKQKLAYYQDDKNKQAEINAEYNEKIAEQDKSYQSATNAMRASALGSIAGQLSGMDFSGIVSGAIMNVINSIFSGVNSKMSTFYQYKGAISARLQGSLSQYDVEMGKVTGLLGMSPWAKQTDVINNMNTLVSQGIAYNVAQRSFLMTIANKIATTFDAANGTLLRLIRLQQADTTAARLGLEANLTTLFNQMFSDTSYLSNAFDRVSEALMETNSLLSASESASFDYIVQKWLGSLVSVGFSESGAESIARAVGLLGSGNISSMSDVETRLLAMSASRAGLSFSDLLTGGLTAQNTNKLLEQMVVYLKEISESNNNVIKAEYAKLFGMNVSDLASLRNLTAGDIGAISGKSLSAGGMLGELSYQLLAGVPTRTSLPEALNNIFDNLTSTMAKGVVDSPMAYAMWLLSDVLGQNADINIPFVSAAGFGIDLNTSLSGLLKAGAIGTGLLTSLPALFGVLSGGLAGSILGLTPAMWGGQAVTPRGRGLGVALQAGLSGTTSQSAFIGTGSSSDIYNQSVAAESGRAKETSTLTGAQEEMPERNIDDVYVLLEEKLGKEASQKVTVESVDKAVLDALGNIFSTSASLLIPKGDNTVETKPEVPAGVVGNGEEEQTYTLQDLINRLMSGIEPVAVNIVEENTNTALYPYGRYGAGRNY